MAVISLSGAASQRVGRKADSALVRIEISLERSLLQQTDAAAKRLHLSRSQLIAQGLKAILKRAG